MSETKDREIRISVVDIASQAGIEGFRCGFEKLISLLRQSAIERGDESSENVLKSLDDMLESAKKNITEEMILEAMAQYAEAKTDGILTKLKDKAEEHAMRGHFASTLKQDRV